MGKWVIRPEEDGHEGRTFPPNEPKEPTFRIDAKRLGTMLELRGINESDLARMIGMHPNGVRRIMRLQSTSFETVNAVSAALDCSPFDLLVAEGHPDPFSARLGSL